MFVRGWFLAGEEWPKNGDLAKQLAEALLTIPEQTWTINDEACRLRSRIFLTALGAK